MSTQLTSLFAKKTPLIKRWTARALLRRTIDPYRFSVASSNVSVPQRRFRKLTIKLKTRIRNKRDFMTPENSLFIERAKGVTKEFSWNLRLEHDNKVIHDIYRRIKKCRDNPGWNFKNFCYGRKGLKPRFLIPWFHTILRVRWSIGAILAHEKRMRIGMNTTLYGYATLLRRIYDKPGTSAKRFLELKKEAEEYYGAPLGGGRRRVRLAIKELRYLLDERIERRKNKMKKIRYEVISTIRTYNPKDWYFKRRPTAVVDIAVGLGRFLAKPFEVLNYAMTVQWTMNAMDIYFDRIKRNDLAKVALSYSVISSQLATERPKLSARLVNYVKKIADHVVENIDISSGLAMVKLCAALIHVKAYDHPLFDKVSEQIVEKRPGYLWTNELLKELLCAFVQREKKGGIPIRDDLLDDLTFEMLLESRRKFYVTHEFVKIMRMLQEINVFHPGVCQEILQRFSPTPGQPPAGVPAFELVRCLKWLFDNLKEGETLHSGPVTLDVVYFSLRALRFRLTDPILCISRPYPLLRDFRNTISFVQSLKKVGVMDVHLFRALAQDVQLQFIDYRPMMRALRKVRVPPELPEGFRDIFKQDLTLARHYVTLSDKLAFTRNRIANLATRDDIPRSHKDKIANRAKWYAKSLKQFEKYRRVVHHHRKVNLVRLRAEFSSIPGLQPEDYSFVNINLKRSFEMAKWWHKSIVEVSERKVKHGLDLASDKKSRIVDFISRRPGPASWLNVENNANTSTRFNSSKSLQN